MKCFPALKLPKFTSLKPFRLSKRRDSRNNRENATTIPLTQPITPVPSADARELIPTPIPEETAPRPAIGSSSTAVGHESESVTLDPPPSDIRQDSHSQVERDITFGNVDNTPLTNDGPAGVEQPTTSISAFNRAESQVTGNGVQVTIVGDDNRANITTQNCNHGAREQLQDLVIKDATHTGKVRADPLRCDPHTRQDILLDITNWIEDEDREHDILWLTGPAGIGKSAIAMSTAEKLSQPNSKAKIAASFFFFRADPKRNGIDGLVPTIAYQLAVSVKDVGEEIDKVIAEDPTVLSATMEVQWQLLVINTVRTVVTRTPCPIPPATIIIDGLDECADAEDQNKVLSLLLSCGSCSPLVFLISSRPEPHLVDSFDANPLASRCRTRIDLAKCRNLAEMKGYIRSQFVRIYNKHREVLQCYCSKNGIWPSDEVIELIAQRADGQYIYTATLFKYMDDNNSDPHDRLQACLEQIPEALSHLDALYIQIMRSSHLPDDERLKDLLFLVCTLVASSEDQHGLSEPTSPGLLSSYWHTFQLTLGRLSLLLYPNRAQCRLALKRLHSVLKIPRTDDGAIEIYHKSFLDFLHDSRRSEAYHIDPQSRATRVTLLCLKKLERGNYIDQWCLVALWWRCSKFLSGMPIPPDLLQQLKKMDFNKRLYTLMKSGPWDGFEKDYMGFIKICKSWDDASLMSKFDSGAVAYAVFADWLRRNYSRIYCNDDCDETDGRCPLSWNALLAFGRAYVKSYAELEDSKTKTQVDSHTWLENMNPNNVVLASLTVFADPGLLLMFSQSDLEELYTWSKGWTWTPEKPIYPSLHTQWTKAGLRKIKADIFH